MVVLWGLGELLGFLAIKSSLFPFSLWMEEEANLPQEEILPSSARFKISDHRTWPSKVGVESRLQRSSRSLTL